MRIPLYDTTSGLSGLTLDELFKKPDLVDVFTGQKNLYLWMQKPEKPTMLTLTESCSP